MEWLSLVLTIVGLILSYVGSRGEIEKIRRRRNLSKLKKDKAFYEALHASASEQTNYLAYSILVVCAIAGALLMLHAMALYPDWETYIAFMNWVAGLSIYMFSLYRLGRYRRATVGFDKTIKRISEEIGS